MSQTLPVMLDVKGNRGLALYLQQVNEAPILSAEEERALAIRLRDEEDLDAARQLVFSHLRYVISVARGFMGYGLPIQDLIQEGNIGLMKAVKRFDPDRDVRLVSFAVHWIRAEIYDYVIKNWRIVKVATTKAQRKLFFNLRKSRDRIGWMRQNEVDDIADRLDVDAAVVKEMESRLTGSDVSFDPLETDDELVPSPAGYLADSRYDPARVLARADQASERSTQLGNALAKLDDRSRDIIQRRWLNEDAPKPTLSDLAQEYGVSAERIRQIEKKAMDNMKAQLVA
ncbi:MAG: RNA polymerase sigma factor RpoH [Gammaproteobacteria bacterium]|nr:RNA polymerase sigma factor RpoH [Gammaproteobacteria bacterium]